LALLVARILIALLDLLQQQKIKPWIPHAVTIANEVESASGSIDGSLWREDGAPG